MIYGLGGVSMSTYHGINYCVFGERAVPFFTILNQIQALIIFILTVFLIGRRCKERRCGDGNYSVDKVVPVIMGNVFCVFADGVKAYIADILPWVYLVIVVLILLVWLLGESDLRRPLKRICFPCCPPEEGEEDDDEEVGKEQILLT